MNYTFAPSAPAPLLRRHLHLGGSNPKGEQITVTSRYLERNARPWLPVMGEYHFVRDNRENWYRELCKMKAGGVDLVATYLFWIYHEEEEGKLDSPALRKKSFTRVAALMGAVIRAGSCWRMVRSGTRLLNTPVPHSTTANAATAASLIGCCKSLFRCGSLTLNIWRWYAIGTAASTARSRGFSSRTADRSWPCSWKMN